MRIKIVKTAIVVLASQHNPTILHPSFLKSQNVVGEGWNPLPQNTVCSLPFSRVGFENGIEITAEPDKVQIVDTRHREDAGDFEIANVICRYVRTLPHVRYTAVGLNFHGFLPVASPESVLMDRFLKDGAWKTTVPCPKASSLVLVYELDLCLLRLTLDPAELGRGNETEKQPGIAITANYHSDVEEGNPPESVAEIVGKMQTRQKHFEDIARTVFDMSE